MSNDCSETLPNLVVAEPAPVDTDRRGFLGLAGGLSLLLVTAGCTSSVAVNDAPKEATPGTTPSNENQGLEPLPKEPEAVLEQSYNENVVGLGSLEEQCRWPGMFTGVMQIVNVSTSDAKGWQTAALSQSVEAGLRPLIVVQPSGLNLAHLRPHKEMIDQYSRALLPSPKQGGVNIEDLGPIALCPEFNAGFGGNPADYARDLNLFMASLKHAVERAPVSNMIDLSEADLLMPHLEDVHAEQLSSVGIQAFANGEKIPFDNQGNADISGYLSTSKIMEVLDALKGPDGQRKPMWINTGIIRKDANLDISYSLEERVAIAMAVAKVVEELRNDGVEILTVNLFAENKLNGIHGAEGDNSERRDFSFHPGDERIPISFATLMKHLGVPLSGFAFKHDYE